MQKINLSVIIVNYKSWTLLERCLESFQHYKPTLSYEIIVIDNDSQDGQFDSFAQQHPDITLVKNGGNYGFSNGNNLGVEHAKGEYLLFLNPDTELTADNALDTMVTFLKENDDVGVVSCRTMTDKKIERELLLSNPWLFIAWARQLYKLFNRKKLKERFPEDANIWYPDWVSGSVVLIKSTLLKQIGGWSSERYWMYHEDPDLCNKVKKLGKKTALLRHVTIKHIGGGTSRKNSKTTILAKTEVMISSHNYIQVTENSALRPVLHVAFAITSLFALLIKSLITLFFNFFKSKVYFLTVISVLKYYVSAIRRKTWKSKKLDGIF